MKIVDHDVPRVRARMAGAPRPIPPETKLLLTYEDVASLVNMPLRTLRNLVRAGNGPRKTIIGRQHFFAMKDVLRWVDELRSASGADL